MTERDIRIQRWTTPSDFAEGTGDGTAVTTTSAGPDGESTGLTIERAAGVVTRTDRFLGSTNGYEQATWTSPEVTPGFTVAEVIPSFTAYTPGRTWVAVDLRGTTPAGNLTTWYRLGEWAEGDTEISRTSIGGQDDADARVRTDVLEGTLTGWQLRVTLARPVGTDDSPVVTSVGAVASGAYDAAADVPSTPSGEPEIALDVPRYSQKVHLGRYPQWDNGGTSWCSPTSVSMIAAFWGTGPAEADYGWVEATYTDPWVVHAARSTYDHTYTGCGNWPFNTAYTGRFGLDGFVTRLRSLREAETLVRAGIPVVISAAYEKGQVPGADYRTNGHLLVLVGFTAAGDPIMNDPAAIDVRKVFGRRELEAAWRAGSGGVAYVIRPGTRPLPAPAAQPNW